MTTTALPLQQLPSTRKSRGVAEHHRPLPPTGEVGEGDADIGTSTPVSKESDAALPEMDFQQTRHPPAVTAWAELLLLLPPLRPLKHTVSAAPARGSEVRWTHFLDVPVQHEGLRWERRRAVAIRATQAFPSGKGNASVASAA